jgi:hypothetical protein
MVSHLVVIETSDQSLGCSRDDYGQSLGCSRDECSVTWL